MGNQQNIKNTKKKKRELTTTQKFTNNRDSNTNNIE